MFQALHQAFSPYTCMVICVPTYVSCIAGCMKTSWAYEWYPYLAYHCTNHHATICVMHETYFDIIHRLKICFMHCSKHFHHIYVWLCVPTYVSCIAACMKTSWAYEWCQHSAYHYTNHHATICVMHETYFDIIHRLNTCFRQCSKHFHHIHVWLYVFQHTFHALLHAWKHV